MRFRVAALIGLVTATLWASSAFAQETGQDEPIEFRKWDLSSTIGVLGMSRRDFGASRSCCGRTEPALAWNVDAGRFFTTHLKVDTGLMLTPSRTYYEYSPVVPGGQYSYVTRHVRPTSFSGALTYQFFENVFAHPYVSAGIRVTVLSEKRQTVTYNPTNNTYVTNVTGHQLSTEARPFVAAGFKSYFNERVYVRPELLIAADSHGVSHGTARFGIGFDF